MLIIGKKKMENSNMVGWRQPFFHPLGSVQIFKLRLNFCTDYITTFGTNFECSR